MKSDREFLQGIYTKAEEMKLSTQTVNDKGPLSKKQWKSIFNIKPTNLRFAMATAAFVLIISSGVFITSLTNEKSIEKPQTLGVIPRGLPITEGEQQIWDKVTDVIEVRSSKDESSYKIVQVYKGQALEKDILNRIKDPVTNLEDGQTAIILLEINEEDIMVLDIYYSEKDNNTYRNLSNLVLTRDSLKEQLKE